MNRHLAVVALLSSVAFAQATPAPSPSEDRAVLNAILAAYAPAPDEIRAIAVEDLGLLGDPRVLDVLANLLLEDTPAVQLAALRSVRVYRHPRAEQILTNLVRHPRAAEALKVSALEALAFQGTPTSRAFLAQVRADRAFGSRLQGTAKTVLERLASR